MKNRWSLPLSRMKPSFWGSFWIFLFYCFPPLFQAGFVFGREPLPSWRADGIRQEIIDFVRRVTSPGEADFLPVDRRIAVFDNDGTLWAEQPMYVQLAFALDRVQALADQHPEWREQQPFKSALEGDLQSLAGFGEKGLVQLIMATHSGMTTDDFSQTVIDWLADAKHPVLKRPYTECIYQPMLELLQYLREHQFKTYIVSGGGVEFMRPWVNKVYGIPPEQVIGSGIRVKYELRDDQPVLVRLPEIDFVNDKEGKPVGIHKYIGQRPVMAFGNSDGDYEMLLYVTSGDGPRLGMLVHHTDGQREFAYDRQSHFGRLDRALDQAAERGWIVVDMKSQWLQIFPSRDD